MDDYSQFGEQAAIVAWAEHVERETGMPGSFVDIGAYDGRTFSNTLALAERGWRGLCIEPAPDAAAACAREHRHRHIVTLAAALTNQASGVAALAWTPGQPYSSLDYDAARAMTDASGIVPIGVAAIHPSGLYELLPQLPEPRFVSIDTEGTSLALFATVIDWIAGQLVCVEAREGAERDRALAFLEHGWRVVATTECNVIAMR